MKFSKVASQVPRLPFEIYVLGVIAQATVFPSFVKSFSVPSWGKCGLELGRKVMLMVEPRDTS